ncbi:MAG TPA: hypothetical protein PLS77_01975 [Anaerolineaceae bacterium]|nr:hypothetical protein [Anaerolineaceae bacterium]HQL40481.1 hypothetical protein [Anaerolineaceae bacterium]
MRFSYYNNKYPTSTAVTGTVTLSQSRSGRVSTRVQIEEIIKTGRIYSCQDFPHIPFATKTNKTTRGSMNPPVNIAKEPAIVFPFDQGMVVPATFLPTISAIPSPPHKTIKAMMPTGDFSHITNVITTKIIPYRSGPRKISFGSPVLLIAITVSRFLITPNPMSRKLAVIRPGMMKARYFDQGCSGKSNQHNTKIGPVPM